MEVFLTEDAEYAAMFTSAIQASISMRIQLIDKPIDDTLRSELLKAAASLEYVSEGEKDWHLRTDDQVLCISMNICTATNGVLGLLGELHGC